jgi:sorting nexin-9/18/33
LRFFFRARVAFPFDATNDVELQFDVGQIVEVTRDDVGGGWWEGQLNGQIGLFPEQYVERIGDDEPMEYEEPDETRAAPPKAARPQQQARSSDSMSDIDAIRNAGGKSVVMSGPRWAVSRDPSVITVSACDEKGSKFGGLKEFTVYEISDSSTSLVVKRRFKHFVWLHEQLQELLPGISIPPIPDKQITGRFSDGLIDQRRRMLERFLNRCARHPVLATCSVFHHFLSVSDDKVCVCVFFSVLFVSVVYMTCIGAHVCTCALALGVQRPQ